MAVTTVPVTIRVNKGIVALAKTEAAKRGTFYQTLLNEALSKVFGVALTNRTPLKKVEPKDSRGKRLLKKLDKVNALAKKIKTPKKAKAKKKSKKLKR